MRCAAHTASTRAITITPKVKKDTCLVLDFFERPGVSGFASPSKYQGTQTAYQELAFPIRRTLQAEHTPCVGTI